MAERKTLTLGKSVNVGSVNSAKGDSIFVERHRKIVIPGEEILKPEVKKETPSLSDQKLQEVLRAAKEKELERAKQQAEEQKLRAKREDSIKQEQQEHQQIKEKLKEKGDLSQLESEKSDANKTIYKPSSDHRKDIDEESSSVKKENKKQSLKSSFVGKQKITIRDIVINDEDDSDEFEIRSAGRRRSEASAKRFREKQKQAFMPAEKITHEVVLSGPIAVKELANQLAEKVGNLIKKLMDMGVMASINQVIDVDTAELVAIEFGATVKRVKNEPFEDLLNIKPNPENMVGRPPVVTVMGHVDHGKTSLLDALRSTDVVAGEAGGITQHIAAYEVPAKNGKTITYLDTPGHETFSAMRARGAQITDIVVIVVAANDSIMPQTVEAINHTKAAGVPMIIAINKIDLPEANPQKVKVDLISNGVQVEEMGGEVLCCEISAKNKINLDKLEDLILLQADMLELKADPTIPAQAQVIEAKMEKGLGATATILMKQGTLEIGQVFVSGHTHGRVRGIINSKNERVKSIGPGQPAVILGFNEVPMAGDDFVVLENEAQAREVAEYRTFQDKTKEQMVKKTSLEELFAKAKPSDKIILPVILKADVQGSVEALRDMIAKIGSDKASVNLLSSGVGAITEGDIRLATASNAIIIAFNVRADAIVRDMARNAGVDIRYHSVVYHITDELNDILTGKLQPERKESFIGYADVLALFTVGKGVKVAGCRVTEGVIKKDALVRLLRDNVVIYDGKIGMLKREKNEVKEVSSGTEFGMSFDNYNNLQVGDRVECYTVENVKASL